MDHDRLYRVMSGEDRSLSASFLRGATAAGEPLYRLGTTVRNGMFNCGLRNPTRLTRPTISVGNITTGGTGKTPVVTWLARRITDMGWNPAILLRGHLSGCVMYRLDPDYKGPPPPRYPESDEALEYGERLGDDFPVFADPDRVRSADYAMYNRPEVDVFLLDDGFQHRQVARDLNLVLIDATRPFGFGHVLPRGLLREPVENLKRADAVIVTRADQVPPEALSDVDRQIERYAGQPPIAHTAHRWENADELAGKAVLGVCGIGNPEAFFNTLESHAGSIVDRVALDDHHAYAPEELRDLLERAEREKADAVVTTEKDYVKWEPRLEKLDSPVPIIRPQLAIDFLDGAKALDALVCEAVAGASESAKPGVP